MTETLLLDARNKTELLRELPLLAERGPVVRFVYGDQERVLVNDPEFIHQFLSYPIRRETGSLQMNARVMGQGLLTTNDLDRWRPRRMLIQRQLSPTNVKVSARGILDRARAAMSGWSEDMTVPVRDFVGRLALENLGESVFGQGFGEFQETVHIALELLVTATDNIEAGRRDPDNEAQLDEYITRLEEVVSEFVLRRENPRDARAHVLDVLMSAKDSGDETFADPFVRDESITLMMAGHDTTAFTIGMSIFLVNKHPDARQRLADEFLAAERLADGDAAEFAKAMPFAKLVASEVMRLYPPVPILRRLAQEDTMVDGQMIHRGDTVELMSWVTHRDGRYFENPLEFDPERFSDERRGQIPKNAYFPFGMGQRVCAGNHFAMLEIGLMVSLLAAEVDLDFAYDEPAIICPSTLKFATPLEATITSLHPHDR